MSESELKGTLPDKGLNQHLADSLCRLCITDTAALSQVRARLKPDILPANLSAEVLAICYGYFDKHGEAPGDHFHDELVRRIKDWPAERQDLIVAYVKKLLAMDAPNVGYVLSRVDDYVVKCRTEAAIEQAAEESVKGNQERAREIMVEAALAAPAERPAPAVWRPFPTEHLPDALRVFVQEGARSFGVDPAFFALPAIVTAAAAIGNTRRLLLKTDWQEKSILWAAIIGKSGTVKSPVLREVVKPLREWQAERYEEYTADLLSHKEAQREAKGRAAGPPPPVFKRIVVGDATVEALAVVQAQNPRGLVLIADELATWLGSFNQYKPNGRGADGQKFLSMYDGDAVQVDRKGADPLYIPRAALSIIGGIQPRIMRRQLTREHFDSGLAARFLWAMPPQTVKTWNDDRISESAAGSYRRAIHWLLEELRPAPLTGEPVDIGLSADARAVWVDYFNKVARMQADADEGQAAALAKQEAVAARLALVFRLVRLADAADGARPGAVQVEDEDMVGGAVMAEWFINETRRVYQTLAAPEDAAILQDLADFIASKFAGRVTANQLARVGHKGCASSDDAKRMLSMLAVHGYGRWQPQPAGAKGGRPTEIFVLNSVALAPEVAA